MSGQRIEDAINNVLRGDARNNALDFVAYLRENEMPPEWAEGIWAYNIVGKVSCVILVNGTAQVPGPWTIWWSDLVTQSREYDWGSVDENIKDIAWTHVNFCANCGCGSAPGEHKMVFGKEYDNVCTSTLAFTNPDAKTLEHIKKLAIIWKTKNLTNR